MKPEPIIFNTDGINGFPSITLLINPETLSLNWKKIITRTRTKSRIVSFYWGQEPVNFSYRGQTGNIYPASEILRQARKDIKAEEDNLDQLISAKQTLFNKRKQIASQLVNDNPDPVAKRNLEYEDSFLEESQKDNDTSINNTVSKIDGINAETDQKIKNIRFNSSTHTELIELSPKYQAFKRLEQLFEASQDVSTLMKVQYRNYIFEGYFESFSFTDDGKNPWNFMYNIAFTVLKWKRNFSDNFPQEYILVPDDKK